jgi:predicted dehydrogenase
MKKYKILQVGCGGISPAWLDVVTKRHDVSIMALVDIDIENAKDKKNRYSLDCPIYTDYKKAIKEIDHDIVIDNTLPSVHKDVVIAALENGSHVFGEKPISDTFENALEMVKRSKETGRSYFVMQNRRFKHDIRSFAALLKNDLVGNLGFIRADFFLGPRFKGFRVEMKSPLILDMAIHTFDQARMISGADPISVYCHEFDPPGSWYDGNAAASCIFEMSDDVVFSYNGSWCAKGMTTSWESDWRAYGSSGSASWDGKSDPIYSKGGNPASYSIEWNRRENHAGCIDEMFAAIKENRPAETDCSDNIKSFAMVMAAIKSSDEKRKIYIKELMER